MKDLMKLDLYDLLNINANASESEIKKAYRKKALTCHPDKNLDNPKAAEDFKTLSKAVEILTDTVKRHGYDKVLRERKLANSKRIFVRITKVNPPDVSTAKYYEEPRKRKQSKEDRRKECPHRQDPKKRTPTWPPSSSNAQDQNENGPKQNDKPKRDSQFTKDAKKDIPPWHSAFFVHLHFLKRAQRNESSPRQNMRRDCPHTNKTKKSAPTWPPSASKTQSKKEGSSGQNTNFNWNFSSILKPATFIPPTTSKGFSNNSFTFSSNQNQTGLSSGFSPIIKPATFKVPSENKASTGSDKASTSSGSKASSSSASKASTSSGNKASSSSASKASTSSGNKASTSSGSRTSTSADNNASAGFTGRSSSSILKPATFIPPSKS